MGKTNKIASILLEAGCDPENIEGIVNNLCKATRGKEVLEVGIAVAIYLKCLAMCLCDDNDTGTNLAVLLDLADAYHIDVCK